MARSPGESPSPNAASDEWAEVEAGLRKAEQQLMTVKDRYSQVRRDLRMQGELRAEQAELEQQQPDSEAMQVELKDIEEQLSQIEVAIESQLFSWDSFREIFWQIVRFTGLGIVIGWVLKGLAG